MKKNHLKGSVSVYIFLVLCIIALIFGALIVNKKKSADQEKAPFVSVPVEDKATVETIQSTISVTDIQKHPATSENLSDIDTKLRDLDNEANEVDNSFNDTAIDVMAE